MNAGPGPIAARLTKLASFIQDRVLADEFKAGKVSEGEITIAQAREMLSQLVDDHRTEFGNFLFEALLDQQGTGADSVWGSILAERDTTFKAARAVYLLKSALGAYLQLGASDASTAIRNSSPCSMVAPPSG